ncbi:MAG: GlcG protein [Xanthobacteraceae bacterium]|jgi:glc operon protein GlcG|nr:GlcG protein [Xanthobacteraceae bacterium]
MLKFTPLALCLLLLADPAAAQATAPTAAPATAPAATQSTATLPYGTVIPYEAAKKAMAAAEAEAIKNKWPVVIAIIDSGGNMVMLHKFDDTQISAISSSEGKARTALAYKRASKDLEDAIAAGGAGLRLVGLQGVTALEGGLPIVIDGKIAGAIGVSGVLSAYNTQVAKAGAEAASKP